MLRVSGWGLCDADAELGVSGCEDLVPEDVVRDGVPEVSWCVLLVLVNLVRSSETRGAVVAVLGGGDKGTVGPLG